MPGHTSGTQCVAVAKPVVTSTVVCDMDLGGVRDVGPEWEDSQWAEVSAEVDGGGDWQISEVLGAESDNFTLGYKQGDFVLCLAGEAAKLDAGDYRAGGGC